MEFNFIETSESQSSYVDENGDMPPHKPEIYNNETLVYQGGSFMVTPFSLLVSVSFVTCFCIKLYTIYQRTIQGERQPIPRVYRYTQRIIQKTLTSDDLEDPLFPCWHGAELRFKRGDLMRYVGRTRDVETSIGRIQLVRGETSGHVEDPAIREFGKVQVAWRVNVAGSWHTQTIVVSGNEAERFEVHPGGG